MKKFNELNVTNSTIIEWEGKELKTIQDPYLYDDGEHYRGHALDKNNNEYMVTWEIINDSDDESERCDWDNPIKVIEI